MKITTRKTISMITGEILEHEFYQYSGPVEECKGASGAENTALANQNALFKTLSTDLSTTFGAQQGILNNLNAGWTPIFQSGPSQYGFSPAEDSALRTQADTGVANNYQQARQATGESIAAVGGGNTFLPTGSTAQLNAQNANAAASQRSGENLGITQAGYETGRQNFLAAANALSGVSAQENPLGYASTAGGANEGAFNMADKINQENQAASPWSIVGGILGGGLLGSFTGGNSQTFSSLFGGNGASGGGSVYASSPSGNSADAIDSVEGYAGGGSGGGLATLGEFLL